MKAATRDWIEKAEADHLAAVDLEAILALALTVEPLWSALLEAARRLKPFGVLIRYPGNDASKAQARRALTNAKAIREEVRLSLGLKV